MWGSLKIHLSVLTDTMVILCVLGIIALLTIVPWVLGLIVMWERLFT